MYTYGYLREATIAHCDITESEAQDMNLLNKLPIWANEGMQAICGTKPNYKYFEPKIVKEYEPVIEIYNKDGSITHQFATEEQKYFFQHHDEMTKDEILIKLCKDDVEIEKYNNSQNIYLVHKPIKLPEDYIAFAQKQSFKKHVRTFNELDDYIIRDWQDNMCDDYWEPTKKNDYMIVAERTIVFNNTGEYKIPYKAVWYRFASGMSDHDEIDMPLDIFMCLSLYIASEALQVDYAQKAQIKRSEFEMALARVTVTDKMAANKIGPIF